MIFYGYEIDSPVSNLCIAQESDYNFANNIAYGDGVQFCSYMKLVDGKQQIFVGVSHDGGETWTPEQASTDYPTYDHYGSSCAVDTAGTGLHLCYSTKGYGPTADRRAYPSIRYRFRDADGVWGTPKTIFPSWNAGTPVGQYRQPSIAIDADNNVHLVASVCYGYNPYFGTTAWVVAYNNFTTESGYSTVNYAWLYYGYTSITTINPVINVDSYCNPHVTFRCRMPNSTYNPDCFTTAWAVNRQQGLLAGWPGGRTAGYVCVGSIPVNGAYLSILCDKSKAGPSGGPESVSAPSWFHRISTCHAPEYFDDVNGYDYPHCVYSFNGAGGVYPAGTYYTWKDATGWHDERIGTNVGQNNPSIALGPDGVIHTLVSDGVGYTYSDRAYRQRATPASAWSTKVTLGTEYIYYPRQLVQVQPTQFPTAAAPCSPFMAVELEGGVNKLKYYKCADVSTITGYGYFM